VESKTLKVVCFRPLTLETSVLMTVSFEHDPQLAQTEDGGDLHTYTQDKVS